MAGSVMRQAFGELVFSRVMNESQDAFGVGRGGTFTVPIALDWGAPATVQPLTAGTSIGIGTQKFDKVYMTINEYGTGIGYETMADWITNIPNRQVLVTSLGNHVARMLNWLDYDILVNKAAFGFTIPIAGSYGALTYDVAGTLRADQGSFGELGPGALAKAYDTFRGALVSPQTQRGNYVAIGNARTFRNLRNGSVFQNMSLYSDMAGLRFQVLGDYMGFTFIETEELTGNGTTLCLGANVAGYGFGKTPQMAYYGDYGQDVGRLQVWKMLFYRGQDAIWRDKGTCGLLIRSNSSAFNYGLMD
jgi:hypothetical protein